MKRRQMWLEDQWMISGLGSALQCNRSLSVRIKTNCQDKGSRAANHFSKMHGSFIFMTPVQRGLDCPTSSSIDFQTQFSDLRTTFGGPWELMLSEWNSILDPSFKTFGTRTLYFVSFIMRWLTTRQCRARANTWPAVTQLFTSYLFCFFYILNQAFKSESLM